MEVCKIISHEGKGLCLNIGNSYNIANGTKVNIFVATGSMDQKWVLDDPKSTKEQFIKNVYNQNFGINALRNGTQWPCTMYKTAGNADGYVFIKETRPNSGLYTIKLARHEEMYLTADDNSRGAKVYWAAKNNKSNQVWKIVVLPKPTAVTGSYITAGKNDWLKLYKKPTGSGGRTVRIPTVSTFKGSDGFEYKFENRSYWYSNEPKMNAYAAGITGAPPVKKTGKQGALMDEHGNYWVAVGPKVVNPHHDRGASPTLSEMYGRGKLDFVVKDKKTGTKYYIPAVVGDTKNHTWSNGVIQTFKSYPNGELYSAKMNFNGTVCAEFIGITGADCAGLNAYEIDSIIFYAH